MKERGMMEGRMMDADREHHAGDVNAAIYMLVITVI